MGKENPIVRGAKAIVRSPVGRIGLTFLALNAGGIGCGAPKPAETPTLPRPTATAVGIGGPESPRTGNPEIDAIGQRLSNPETRGQVPEPEILRWNEAIEARAGALAATATAEAQKPNPTPELFSSIVSKETPRITPPINEIRNEQEEVAKRGEPSKIPIPAAIPNEGIKQSAERPDGWVGLFLGGLSPGEKISFPALVGGKVAQAERINKTTKVIKILVGNERWSFAFPSTADILVGVGQGVKSGVPLFDYTYNPDDPTKTQQDYEYEGHGVGMPQGTIVQVSVWDTQTNQPGKVTRERLMGLDKGALKTISPLS